AALANPATTTPSWDATEARPDHRTQTEALRSAARPAGGRGRVVTSDRELSALRIPDRCNPNDASAPVSRWRHDGAARLHRSLDRGVGAGNRERDSPSRWDHGVANDRHPPDG